MWHWLYTWLNYSLVKNKVSISVTFNYSVFPYPFLKNLSLFAKECALSILFSVFPVPIIIFAVVEYKFYDSMFFTKHIISIIARSITPLKFADAVHLSLLPLSYILSLVRVHYLAYSMGYESFLINFTCVNASVRVLYDGVMVILC